MLGFSIFDRVLLFDCFNVAMVSNMLLVDLLRLVYIIVAVVPEMSVAIVAVVAMFLLGLVELFGYIIPALASKLLRVLPPPQTIQTSDGELDDRWADDLPEDPVMEEGLVALGPKDNADMLDGS